MFFGISSETRGFSLAFEYQIPATQGTSIGIKPFLGWGGQRKPTAKSGGNNYSTYYPQRIGPSNERTQYDLPYDFREYSIGVELNSMLGKRKHFIEVGAGTALDIFDIGVNYYAHRRELGATPSIDELKAVKPSSLTNHYYSKIGYRYVSNRGLTLGVGLSAMDLEGLFTYYYADTDIFTPYLSIGVSF